MKFRAFAGLLLLATTLCCISCNSNNTNTATLTVGNIFVATAGNTSVQAYGITLSSGALSTDGQGVGTGTGTGSLPTAMAISPDATTLVVANSTCQSTSGCLTIYTINGDGSLTAISGTTSTGISPIALTFNPTGAFLFVANQGNFTDQNTSSISVYSVSGTTLKEVAGSPFSTVPPGGTTPTMPSAVAVSASGNFLYVANNLTSTVSIFKIASSGALTQSTFGPYSVGANPVALGITPTGSFLYVANFGDNNISALAICDKETTTCSNPNMPPDGSLTTATGSPFSAGIGPTAITTNTTGSFLYVADKTSNQISQFRISSGTGTLSPLTPASVSTGTTPFSFAVRLGTTTIATTGGTTEYLYVTNNGSTSISTFSFDSTAGILGVLGQPTTTISGNPTAVVAR